MATDITIYGRTIHVYDCDQYTREFYANLQIPQPEAEAAPTDNFELLPQQAVIHHDRDFNESYLGGVRVPSQKQFLDHDRKVRGPSHSPSCRCCASMPSVKTCPT